MAGTLTASGEPTSPKPKTSAKTKAQTRAPSIDSGFPEWLTQFDKEFATPSADLEQARISAEQFPGDPSSAVLRTVSDIDLDKELTVTGVQTLKAQFPDMSEEELAKEYFQNRKKASLQFRQKTLDNKTKDRNYRWTPEDDAEFIEVTLAANAGKSQLQRAGELVVEGAKGIPSAVIQMGKDLYKKALVSSARAQQDYEEGKVGRLGASAQAVKDFLYGAVRGTAENLQGAAEQGAEIGELAYDLVGAVAPKIDTARLEAESELRRMKVRRAIGHLFEDLADVSGVNKDSIAAALGNLYSERFVAGSDGIGPRMLVNPAKLTNATVGGARMAAGLAARGAIRTVPTIGPVAAGMAIDAVTAGTTLGAGTVLGAMVTGTAKNQVKAALRRTPGLNARGLIATIDEVADDVAKVPGDVPLGDWLAQNGRSAASRKVGNWIKNTTTDGNFTREMLTTIYGIPMDAFTGGAISAAMAPIGQEEEAAAYGAAATGMMGAMVGVLGGNRASQIRAAFDATAKRGASRQYGLDPELDVAHAQTLAKADRLTQNMVNHMRGGLADHARVYFVTEDILTKRGLKEGADGMAVYKSADGTTDIFINASRHSNTIDKLKGEEFNGGLSNWIKIKNLLEGITPMDYYSLAANARGILGHEALHALFRSLPEPIVDQTLAKIKETYTETELQEAADRYNRLVGTEKFTKDTIVNEIAADLAGRQFSALTGFAEFQLPPTMSGKIASKFGEIVDRVGEALGGSRILDKTNLGLTQTKGGARVVRDLLTNYFRIPNAEALKRLDALNASKQESDPMDKPKAGPTDFEQILFKARPWAMVDGVVDGKAVKVKGLVPGQDGETYAELADGTEVNIKQIKLTDTKPSDVELSPGDDLGRLATNREIVSADDLIYNGAQLDADGNKVFDLWTDKVTKGTFAVKVGEDILTKAQAVRDTFTRQQEADAPQSATEDLVSKDVTRQVNISKIGSLVSEFNETGLVPSKQRLQEELDNIAPHGKPTGEFWNNWRKYKNAMMEMGIRVKKVDDRWEVKLQ